jgi:NtrC-family two-component system sensor histidine kinase KinB
VLYVPDLRKEPVLLDMSGGAARAQLCVPMIHEGRVLGVLSLESERPEAYSAADQAFAAQLATQATIAMVNAELYARAHERLSELAMVLNSLGEGFLVVDHTGQITLVNQAVQSLTHLPLGEFTGKALLEISPQALACLGYSREEAEALVQSLAQGRAPLSSRNTIRLPELPEHILERTSLPIWDPMRRSVGCMIVLRNITEEIQVAQARELITETLVHDLRSPITSILGALDVMLDLFQRSHPAADEDLILQAVNVARRGAQRVLNMVESLLEIARLESGKMEIIPTVFNLRPLVNNVLSEFLPQSTEYGLILRNEVAEDAPAVYADAAKTLRVLTNLVDNAVKFTPAGGRIIVSSTRFGNNMLAVQVSDTGPGVPQDYREKIFERFSQVPGVIGRRRGSGLGLTFCRLAVEAQGGKIWVEPRPGGGSIFTFTLPLAHSQ